MTRGHFILQMLIIKGIPLYDFISFKYMYNQIKFDHYFGRTIRNGSFSCIGKVLYITEMI